MAIDTIPRVKFEKGNQSEFYTKLRQRVDHYFKSTGKSRHADWRMVAKAVFFFILMLANYAIIISGWLTPLQTLPFVIFFGLSSAFFVFNVAHDASHGAFSSNKKINKLLSYSWNLVGISSHIWNLKHNVAHHTYTNVAKLDGDIEQGFLLRFHPWAPRKFHHRFQHLYAPLLYGLFSIYLIFIKDFQMYRMKRFGNKIIEKHPFKEYIILIVSKLFYVGYNFIIPAIVLDVTWWQILIAFFLMHMCIGNVMAFILTPVHINDEATFTRTDPAGNVNGSWAEHQLESTIDMAPESEFLHFISGGLNTHIAHHIFPNICHIHYIPITRIIRQTAEECGLKYRSVGFFEAMRLHLSFLKKLGREEQVRLAA